MEGQWAQGDDDPQWWTARPVNRSRQTKPLRMAWRVDISQARGLQMKTSAEIQTLMKQSSIILAIKAMFLVDYKTAGVHLLVFVTAGDNNKRKGSSHSF